MENVTCAVCGADDSEILFEGKDEWHHLPGRFPVRRCCQCRLIYLSPRPDRSEIGRYYPDEYAPYQPAVGDAPSLLQRFERRYALYKRIKAIQRYVPGQGRVLDVGCATGNFLAALQARGWDVYGVETNANAAAYARRQLNANVFAGELEEARFPNNFFDLIVFWDVLEHVHQPRLALTEAARIARPGARLLLVLPNPDSLEAQLFGQYWAGWDVPRHLQIFPLTTIERLLRETGWQVNHVICLTGRHWLFNLSLQHWLNHHVSSAAWRKIILMIARLWPVRILTLPYFVIVEKVRKGSVMAIFAAPV